MAGTVQGSAEREWAAQDRAGRDRGGREARGAARGSRPVRPQVSVEETAGRRRRRATRPVERPGRAPRAVPSGPVLRLVPPPVGDVPAGVGPAPRVGASSPGTCGAGAAPGVDGAGAVRPRVRPGTCGADVAPAPAARRPVSAARYRVRRSVAGVVLALVAAAAVVGLGTLADVAGAAQARSTVPAGAAEVVVRAGDTVWDLARREVPDVNPAAVVERIVRANGLADASAALLPAGRVLLIPA